MVLRGVLIPLLLLAFFLPAYSAADKHLDLLPTDVVSYQSTRKIISVMPVTQRPQPKPGFMMVEPTRINNEEFHMAIVEALDQSNLFSEVKIDGVSDYQLKTDIIGQRCVGGGSNIGLFLVRYSLIETQSGSVVWAENLFSHNELDVNDMFSGAGRVRKLLGNLGQDNIIQLLNNIGDVLSKAEQQE